MKKCVYIYISVCVCACVSVCVYMYIYISVYMHKYIHTYIIYICIYIYMLTPPPQLARTSSEDVSSLLQSVAGKLLFVRHQLSIFVDAGIKVLMFL